MSDTPETDGEWNRIACYEHPQFEQAIAGFARKLERERNDWKHRAESYETNYNEINGRINLLKRMGILSSRTEKPEQSIQP